MTRELLEGRPGVGVKGVPVVDERAFVEQPVDPICPSNQALNLSLAVPQVRG